MQAREFFAADYAEARGKFRAAVAEAGLAYAEHRHPARGPQGEALSTDVVRIGPRGASRLVLALSSTHGAEGFCGSGCQTGWLRSGELERLPADTAVLLIHAINPYGFAWLRRVNEDNVDINRNFVRHGDAYPANLGYAALREAICPAEWSAASRAAADATLEAYAARHGSMALQGAISGGQYVDPAGIFYGGTAPVWSHRTLVAILREHGAGVRQAGCIDLHTGLGPYGVGEIINLHYAGDAGRERIMEWFGGEATSIEGGTSSSARVTGDTSRGVAEGLPDAAVACVGLEYGTRPLKEVLDSLRADNWLHVHGTLASREGREIKAQIRDAFYPDKDDWKDMVIARSVDVLRRMLRGLAEA
ncbi:MAG: M14 family metallopeptidase [Alphaproteobacteria bacterium]